MNLQMKSSMGLRIMSPQELRKSFRMLVWKPKENLVMRDSSENSEIS